MKSLPSDQIPFCKRLTACHQHELSGTAYEKPSMLIAASNSPVFESMLLSGQALKHIKAFPIWPFNMESVSIIIPTYKRGEILRRTLPSYLNQKFVKEVIIVDDGGFAFDYIKDIVEEHKRLIRYLTPVRRLGLPGARNYGVSEAIGDFIIFGEDDVEFALDYVETLARNMRKENADMICGRQIFVYDGETKKSAIRRSRQLTEKDLYICYPMDVNFSVDAGKNLVMHTISPFSLMRRNVFNKLKFDETIGGNYHREENDFFVRAERMGYKLVFCNEALMWHLHYLSKHGGCRTQSRLGIEWSLFRNNVWFWRRHYKFLKKRLGLKWPMVCYALKYSADRYTSYLKARLFA